MEDLYYEKVYLSTGEVPEKDGDYDTDIGLCKYGISGTHTHNPFKPQYRWTQKGRYGTDEVVIPEYFMKPVSISPKEEAVELIKWIDKRINEGYMWKTEGEYWYLNREIKRYEKLDYSQLYTKFKEGR